MDGDCWSEDLGIISSTFIKRRPSSPEVIALEKTPANPRPVSLDRIPAKDGHLTSVQIKREPFIKVEDAREDLRSISSAPGTLPPAYTRHPPRANRPWNWVNNMPAAVSMSPVTMARPTTEFSECTTDGELDWWSERSSPEPGGSPNSSTIAKASTGIVERLLESFTVWREHGSTHEQAKGNGTQDLQASSSSCSSSNASSQAISTSQKQSGFKVPSRKRQRDDEDDGRPAQRQKSGSTAEQSKARLLACPFAKHDPLRHGKCYKYMIQEISRLKWVYHNSVTINS